MRETVLDPDDYDVVRTTRINARMAFQVLLLAQGRRLVASEIRTPDRIGLPLHLVGTDGEIVRSFGSRTEVFRPDVPYIDARAVTHAGPGRVWSAHRNRYVVELWDTAGSFLKSIERHIDWFPAQLTRKDRDVHGPPPYLDAIIEDDSERLWINILLPDPDWQTAIEAGGLHGRVVDEIEYRDSMLEILNPATGQIVAQRRYEIPTTGILGDGWIYSAYQDGDGVPRLSLRRLSVSCP